jgi:protein gp37
MPLEQPYLNVWLGVSVEDQKTADERIPLLLQTPAAVRFVSYEPALGPVDFIPYLDPSCQALNRLPRAQVDWVIAGGESGPSARPPHPQWVLHVRDQCEAAGTPFFFKQWGEWQWVTYVDGGHGILKVSVPGYSAGQQPKKTWREIVFSNGAPGTSVNMLRVGKARAGRTVSGREWNEFPQVPA